MIRIEHSKTGKGSVIFNDQTPLILIRNGNWTFCQGKYTVLNAPKEIHRELVKIALTCGDRLDKILYQIQELGADHEFEYCAPFRGSSIKLAEREVNEL